MYIKVTSLGSKKSTELETISRKWHLRTGKSIGLKVVPLKISEKNAFRMKSRLAATTSITFSIRFRPI